MKQRDVVRTIYLYLVTVVGIVMALTGVIGTLTNLLNMYVFQLITPDNMQSEIAMLLSFASAVAVGIPVWLYHWGIIQESRHHVGRSPATESATQAAAEITAPVEMMEVIEGAAVGIDATTCQRAVGDVILGKKAYISFRSEKSYATSDPGGAMPVGAFRRCLLCRSWLLHSRSRVIACQKAP